MVRHFNPMRDNVGYVNPKRIDRIPLSPSQNQLNAGQDQFKIALAEAPHPILENTVKTHIRSIYRKLDSSSRSEAVESVRDIGLLQPD